MKKERNTLSVSSKGQIVIPKAIREKYRLEKGAKLLVREVEGGILLTPCRPLVEEVKEIARGLEGKWPKNLTSVDIVRRERGKYG
jgi:AbrB family looped-hinge helix DNA binding protein